MTTLRNGNWRVLVGFHLALLVAIVAIYAPVAHFGFLRWDDQLYVTENAHVLHGLSWPGVWWALTTGTSPYWHPVTWMSHELDVTLFGTAAGWHHVTSIAWHAAATLLLFEFFRRATGAFWRSAFVAAIFAVHPLHVESVAWIAERKDVVSTCFVSLALLAYLAYTRASTRRAAWYALTCGLFAVALMSKPMVVTLPLLLLLLDVWPLGRARFDAIAGWKRLLVEKVPLVVLAIATGVVTVLTQHSAGALADLNAISWPLRVKTALTSYVAYLCAALWPARLAAFYPHDWSMPWYLPAGSAVLLAGISAIAIRLRGSRPFVLVGWLWYLGSLALVIGLLQAGEQARADRFMYLPIVGLSIIAAWGVPLLVRQPLAAPPRRLLMGLAALVVAALATAARIQVSYWADDVTLWSHTVAVTDRNYLGYDLLGLAFRDRGRWNDAIGNYAIARRYAPATMGDFTALLDDNTAVALVKLGRVEDALPMFRSALRLKPDLFEAESDLATSLMLLRRPAEAIPHFETAILVHPGFAEAYDGLGAAHELLGDFDHAEQNYRRAIGSDPALAVAHANLAMVLVRQGRLDDATAELLAAIHIDPTHIDWHYNAGALLASTGRVRQAADQFTAALAEDPSYEPAKRALDRLPH